MLRTPTLFGRSVDEMRNTICEMRHTKYEIRYTSDEKWRRRESNPHFRDATAACSRYTTSPNLPYFTLSHPKSEIFLVRQLPAAGQPWRMKNLKPPALVADYFFHRLSLRLFWLVRRIPDRHKLNYRNILRDAHYRPHLVRIE